MDLHTAIDTFLLLPRNRLMPNGFDPNHWYFSVKYVPCEPSITILFLLNPYTLYCHCAGPLSRRLFPSELVHESTALEWAVCLIRAFTTSNLGTFRPWTWSTDDAAMAAEVGRTLGLLGVGDGLEVVGVATSEERRIADEEWLKFWDEFRDYYEARRLVRLDPDLAGGGS